MTCFPTIYPMFPWFSTSISAGLDFLPEEVNQTLIPVEAEPFVVQLLLSYCSFPLTSTTGSGRGSPAVPLSPIHVPSSPHCVPCCQLGCLKADTEVGVWGARCLLGINTSDIKEAEAEWSIGAKLQYNLAKPKPAWWGGSSEGRVASHSVTGYPRKGVACARWLLAAKGLISGSWLQTMLSVAGPKVLPSKGSTRLISVFHRQQLHFFLGARHNHPINLVNSSFYVCSVNGLWKPYFWSIRTIIASACGSIPPLGHDKAQNSEDGQWKFCN